MSPASAAAFAMAGAGALLWAAILLLPWRPWSTRESLDAPAACPGGDDLRDITALIPARNEEATIQAALRGLQAQGEGLSIIVIDDRSDDATARAAAGAGCGNLRILRGEEPPPGWSGKVWALQQGLRHATSRFTLLLDADIELRPGIIARLRRLMLDSDLQLASLMARPALGGFWERLLLPAFVFFFKLLYPFSRANTPGDPTAAAAGGCILLDTKALRQFGFAAIRGELIDDCALAGEVKRRGGRTWIGLTRSAASLRGCSGLADIWSMVSRTAYTQLRYSPARLLCCAALMMLAFWAPAFGVILGPAGARMAAAAGLCCMAACYGPLLRYYGLPVWWCAALPVAGTLFLCMTAGSAARYYRGLRSEWKGRVYLRDTQA